MENLVRDIASELTALSQMVLSIKTTQNEQQLTLNSLTQQNATEGDDTVNLTPTVPRPANTINLDQLFKIPDPIKSLQTFDGNRRQLVSWLQTAEKTLNLFKPYVTNEQFEVYTTAVVNKIEGRAKDIICLAGNPQSFDEIKEILAAALGDRQELSTYKSQLCDERWCNNTTLLPAN